MFFTSIFVLVVLGFCWWSGDLSIWTKLVFTLLVGASWLLLLVGYPWVIVAHCILIAVIGCASFGPEFLSRRVR